MSQLDPLHHSLCNIRTGYDGFRTLTELDTFLVTAKKRHCLINLSDVSWIDANMCAAFGAILSRHHKRGVNLQMKGIRDSIMQIIRKNHFGRLFGLPDIEDKHLTTIEFASFDRQDSGPFQKYVLDHFHVGAHGLPIMTEALLKKFRQNIHEIFSNSVEHSETESGIFACGQQYPQSGRLDFSIVDLGIGIKNRIKESLGQEMDAVDAIGWAMKEKTTTRRGMKPGGLGLNILREFIGLNSGRIVVVSDQGYWEMRGGELQTKSLPLRFRGTAVTIEIKTTDKAAYALSSEINSENVF